MPTQISHATMMRAAMRYKPESIDLDVECCPVKAYHVEFVGVDGTIYHEEFDSYSSAILFGYYTLLGESLPDAALPGTEFASYKITNRQTGVVEETQTCEEVLAQAVAIKAEVQALRNS